MPHLTLRLLGSPRVDLDGVPVRTDRRKAVALLAYLAVTGGTPSRESLGALFWPDYGQSQAFAYLRRTIWELNQILGEGWIVSTRECVGVIQSESIWVDVLRFDELLSRPNTIGWNWQGPPPSEFSRWVEEGKSKQPLEFVED